MDVRRSNRVRSTAVRFPVILTEPSSTEGLCLTDPSLDPTPRKLPCKELGRLGVKRVHLSTDHDTNSVREDNTCVGGGGLQRASGSLSPVVRIRGDEGRTARPPPPRPVRRSGHARLAVAHLLRLGLYLHPGPRVGVGPGRTTRGRNLPTDEGGAGGNVE